MVEEDEPLYRRDRMLISKTLTQFGSTTFPIANIGSMRIEPAKKQIAPIVVGVALIVVGIAGAISKPGSELAGLVLCGLGALVIWRSGGGTHKLMIRTGSGDQQAYESKEL